MITGERHIKKKASLKL